MKVSGCSALSSSPRSSHISLAASDRRRSEHVRVRVRADLPGGPHRGQHLHSGPAPSPSAPRQQERSFLGPRQAVLTSASRGFYSDRHRSLRTADAPRRMRGFGRRALSAVSAAVSRTNSSCAVSVVPAETPSMFACASSSSFPSAAAAAAAATFAPRRFDGASTAPQTRRSSVVAGARRGSKNDNALTNIPNIGPVSAGVLSDVGIPDIPTLKTWYSLREGQQSDVIVETLCKLKGNKGNLRAPAARALVSYLKGDKEMVQEQAEEEAERQQAVGIITPGGRNQGLTVCVEGNIGVGKTTFLQKLIGQSLELQEVVEVVPEPVEEWQDVGNDHVNLLDLFYQDQQRYAYTFQHYVFVTRVMQEKRSRERLQTGSKTLRMLERSVFSDRMVFVRAVHEARCMSDVELNVYDSWFSPMVNALPTLIPDGFIYLRADPLTCLTRMAGRGRNEEVDIDISYLESLHSKHEDWLNSGQDKPFSNRNILLPNSNSGPKSVGFSPVNTPAPPEVLRGKIIHLERNDVASLESVPALVLDYNTNIDIENDVEAQKEYVSQVVAYKEYLMQCRKAQKGLWTPSPQAPILPNMDTIHNMSSGVQLRN